jgi:programmed cell death 6-interacting protein
MSLSDGDNIIPATQAKSPLLPPSSTGSHTRKEPPPKSALGLPALGSNEWGFEEISLPPGPILDGKMSSH